MDPSKWTISIKVYRQKGGEKAHFDLFTQEVAPDEYVLDVVERIWAFQDRSLVFGHACHHSTCGACGMRVNGVEKLTCITPLRDVTRDGGTLLLEPLNNFPRISDLAVDLSPLYARMGQVGHRSVLMVKEEHAPGEKAEPYTELRLADCIECGLCISACPAAMTSPAYLGPAVLAGAQQNAALTAPLCALVETQDGAWRCHSAYECSEVCPSFVDPAARIMDLRRRLVARHIRRLFGLEK
jgi:succinate dehydrogenase / fumarate reductase iron-sulfur subunit